MSMAVLGGVILRSMPEDLSHLNVPGSEKAPVYSSEIQVLARELQCSRSKVQP